MNRILTLAARRPWVILLLLLAASLLAVSRLGDLQVKVSVKGMMERGTPAWETLQKAQATFGSDSILVLFLADGQLFTPRGLAAVKRMLDGVRDVPGVSRVTSLFSIRNLKEEDGYITSKPYIETLPETIEQAEAIRDEALDNPLLVNSLIAGDGSAMAVNLVFEDDGSDPAFAQNFSAAIEAHLAPLREQFDQAFQIGSPTIRAALSERILEDQRTLLPLSVLVLLLTLALSLRRLSGAMLPMLTAGLSVLWTLGFMAWMGIPVNVMTSIVPALIVVIGSTEDIHLLSEYFNGLDAGKRGMKAIGHMADHMGVTVLLTFITTYLGFLSIALNDVQLLYQFGLVASTGLLFNFLITVVLIPLFLRAFGARIRTGKREQQQPGLYARIAVWLMHWVLRRRWLVLAAVSLMALLALIGAGKLRVNNNAMDFLEPSSVVHAQAREVHERLSGIHTFSIVVDGRIQGTFKQLHYLRQLEQIQAHIDTLEALDKSFSLVDFVKLINRTMEGYPEALELPEADDILREYLLFIKHDSISQYVSQDFSSAKILVRHDIGDSEQLNALVAQLEEFVAQNVDDSLKVEITGNSILSNKAVDSMARGQLHSLVLLGGVILLLITILFVNFKAGLVALLPNLFPVLVLFGVMGFVGIPLDSGTGMVAAIALGICVDDTMHAMSRYNQALKEHGDQMLALQATMSSEAVPIFTTSLALSAGFGVLALSSFAPVAHFGMLSAMVILLALFATFVITPLLLGTSQLLTVWDMLSMHIQKDCLKRAPLFTGMNTWQIKKVLLASEVRQLAPEDYVVRVGEEGKEMYVLLDGQVQAQLTDEQGETKIYRQLNPGDLFGEVGPLTGGRRTADVISLRDSRVLVLTWDHIESLSRMFPFISLKLFRNFTRILSDRLRATAEYSGGGDK